jgi:hypothetical protein
MGDETSSRATCQCELSFQSILSEWRSVVCIVVHTATSNVHGGAFFPRPAYRARALTVPIAQQCDDVRTVVENRQHAG